MKTNMYYDSTHDKLLTEDDACTFDKWSQEWPQKPFTMHPNGFPVFLPPDKLDSCDEYAHGDPHGVRQGLKSQFQTRRIQCTIDLLKHIHDSGTPLQRLLDLGCGQAYLTARIQERFPETEIAGLDYSLSAIAYAHQQWPQIDFCVADAHHPPYEPEYFDIVVCNNIWEHVPDPVSLLQALARVLEPGGHLVISTPSRYRLDNLAKVIFGRPPTLMAANHVTEYSIGQVIEQLKYAGFTTDCVMSRPLRESITSLKQIIAYKIVLPVLRTYLRTLRSHHQLESTVFFLATKT